MAESVIQILNTFVANKHVSESRIAKSNRLGVGKNNAAASGDITEIDSSAAMALFITRWAPMGYNCSSSKTYGRNTE